MLWAVHTYHPELFERIFVNSEDVLLEYWTHARQQPWFDAHPGRQKILEGATRTLPLRLHGDDAPINKATSVLLLSLGSPLSYEESSYLPHVPNIRCWSLELPRVLA